MVTTATFAHSAAIPRATAAETVVLPTPPDPPHTHTRFPASSRVTLTDRPRERFQAASQLNLELICQSLELGPVEILAEDERQLRDPAVQVQPGAQAVQLGALGLDAHML